jgi:hypothetical protein
MFKFKTISDGRMLAFSMNETASTPFLHESIMGVLLIDQELKAQYGDVFGS